MFSKHCWTAICSSKSYSCFSLALFILRKTQFCGRRITIIIVFRPFLCTFSWMGFSWWLFSRPPICVKPGCSLDFSKSSLIIWVHVLHGLSLSLAVNSNELTIVNWHFYIHSFNMPNHLSPVWCKTSTMLTIPNLCLNSADYFLSLWLTLHNHCAICMSVREIPLISLPFKGRFCYHIT